MLFFDTKTILNHSRRIIDNYVYSYNSPSNILQTNQSSLVIFDSTVHAGTWPGPVQTVFWTGSFLKTCLLEMQKF